MKEFKILVSGSRDWDDRRSLDRALNYVHKLYNVTCLVHGKCPTGADVQADLWAVIKRIDVKRYPAKWTEFGHPAGHIRNKEMLDDNPDIKLVVLFPLKQSKGTYNMKEQAENAGIRTWTPYEP